jgi:hypothetical protein
VAPLPIAAKQVERPPAERRGALCPAAIKEPAAIVDELQPPQRRHVGGRAGRIEPRQCLRPFVRRASIVLDNGRAFVLVVSPGIGLQMGIFAAWGI